jgi:hypothetical protein
MHEQILLMKKNQLAKVKDERAALDAEIAVLETELGLSKPATDQPTPAKQFQAERDSKPNPFAQK